MKSVLLVDDHPVVAVGLGLVLQHSDNLALVGTAADPAGLLAMLETCRPDAVVIDLVFAGLIQLDLITRCRAALPDVVIVVFSSLPEALYGRQALSAGADAYLNKSADLSVLARVLAEWVARPSPRSSARHVPPGEDAPTPTPFALDSVHLTQREIEIAHYIGRGLSMSMIAQEIGVSAKTVAAHRDNIRKKLRCRDTKDLVARLARLDLARLDLSGIGDGAL